MRRKTGIKWVNEKILIWLLTTLFLAPVFSCRRAAAEESPRIGILTPYRISGRAIFFEAFRQSLRELGYVEDRTLPLRSALRRGKAIGFPHSRESW